MTPKDIDIKNEIEAAALRLYDRLNPEPDRTIIVSKHECIKMARQEYRRHKCTNS
jgi:hypothetical protein